MYFYKFRVYTTDGQSHIAKGVSTTDPARVKSVALEIARLNGVQSVKPLKIPANER